MKSKPGKILPVNYRQTSLMNADVKIYIKTLANRIWQYLEKIAHSDQVRIYC